MSGESKLLDEARADAIADARRKAELYAKAAGAKVGKVVAIIEQGSSPPPRPFQAMRASAGAVPVAPGEQMLRATRDGELRAGAVSGHLAQPLRLHKNLLNSIIWVARLSPAMTAARAALGAAFP